MTRANVRLAESTFMDKTKALGATLPKLNGNNESTGLGMIKAIEPETELFSIAEQVDLAEKAFHDAHARRNEAQIAYLRQPTIIAHVALEAAKTAEADALEILDVDVRWLASTRRHDGNRAEAEGVVRFNGGQARRQHCRRHLATLRTGRLGAASHAITKAFVSKRALLQFGAWNHNEISST